MCRCLLYICLGLSSAAASAQDVIEPAFPLLTFSSPVDLQAAGDGTDRLFVVEQRTGRIRVFPNDPASSTSTVFLDISARINSTPNEAGLLGLVFHPDYEQNGYFFVNYTASNPFRTVVERFKVSGDDADVADPDSSRIILEVTQPATNHNAGQMAFGPDGYLYIALGDGGQTPSISQDIGELLGSMLRIDVNGVSDSTPPYFIPADNPYVGSGSGFREEAWAHGFRNPWRFSFDEAGNLWLADVGDSSYEEVDIVEKGGNYGWPIMEGGHCRPPASSCSQSGLTTPVAEYGRSDGRSVTGGYVYRGARVPELQGMYVFADYVSGRIWSLSGASGGYQRDLLVDADFNVSSFGVDESGELFIVAHNGVIHRLVATSTAVAPPPGVEAGIGYVYPNPASDVASITIELQTPATVATALFDLLGRQVARQHHGSLGAGEWTLEVPVSHVPAGVYTIQTLVGGRAAWRRVVVSR